MVIDAAAALVIRDCGACGSRPAGHPSQRSGLTFTVGLSSSVSEQPPPSESYMHTHTDAQRCKSVKEPMSVTEWCRGPRKQLT